MPRAKTNADSRDRMARIIESIEKGKLIKVIADDEGLSVPGCRTIIWQAGFRAMTLSPAEQELIRKNRKKRR